MGGRFSKEKGKRGEREFAEKAKGKRTWEKAHDVEAHGLEWEVKFYQDGFGKIYEALEEAKDHGGTHVVAKQNRRPWFVAIYYEDWLKEREQS